ncbi:carotenoid oxygenase family protein, partial [Candidatus Dependentiae bacterium]|nr:carotenoid oxygenase family protein [Candidatus Dependentiae bacterium]
MKSILFLSLLGAAVASHDLYYGNQKKALFKKTVTEYREKVLANPALLLYTSLDQEIVLPELQIKGVVPAWLEGTLIRNSAAKFETSTQHVHHVFDGCAMLHMFSFSEGTVGYANKFLKTNYYTTALETGSLGKGFSADPCKLLFANVLAYFTPKKVHYDNANVNIAKIADKFVALTETPLPIEFDLKTLNTRGPISFDDNLKGQVTTAHPHYDYETEESFNYLTHFGRESFYHVYSMPFKSKTRKLIASIPVKKPSYMHSFSITKQYIILTEIPFRVNPLHLLLMNKPFIKNFVWNPQEGTIFTVVNRTTGELVGRYKGEPFFTFHHVNAFEEKDTIIVDLIAYKDPSSIDNLT